MISVDQDRRELSWLGGLYKLARMNETVRAIASGGQSSDQWSSVGTASHSAGNTRLMRKNGHNRAELDGVVQLWGLL